MKNKKELPLSQQIENLELANQTLRNYAKSLEEKLARYENIMQHCPRFLAEQTSPAACSPHPTDPYDDFYDNPDDDFGDDFDDDWDGLEDSDFEDDWEDDEFLEEDE